MTARILRGTETSALIRGELRARVTALRERGMIPALGVVLVGEDPASVSYVTATPVPGGVGPMTVTMLLLNVVDAAERAPAARGEEWNTA